MERAHDVSLVELQMLAEALAGNACPVQSAAAVRRFVMLAAKEGRATNRWERPERDPDTPSERNRNRNAVVSEPAVF